MTSAIIALKSLVQSQKAHDVVPRLAERLQDVREHRARACIIWLVGQYDAPGANGRDFAPDVLRVTARDWESEVGYSNAVSHHITVLTGLAQASGSKLAALTLATKLLSRDPVSAVPTSVSALARYVFALARADSDVDVRDRGRMLTSLVERAGLLPADKTAANSNHFAANDLDEDAWRSGVETVSYENHENGDHTTPIGVLLRPEQVRLVMRAGKGETKNLPLWTRKSPPLRNVF